LIRSSIFSCNDPRFHYNFKKKEEFCQMKTESR
jgi:hypothetical protein